MSQLHVTRLRVLHELEFHSPRQGFAWPVCSSPGFDLYFVLCTIFIALAIRVDTSVMLDGMISVVVASEATLL